MFFKNILFNKNTFFWKLKNMFHKKMSPEKLKNVVLMECGTPYLSTSQLIKV